jgi:two-component system phosphate regulon sensor histidine kinase PhoR
LNSLFLRRLLLPYLALLLALFGIVAVVAALRIDSAARVAATVDSQTREAIWSREIMIVAWTSVSAAIVGVVAAIAIAGAYLRRQSADIVDRFASLPTVPLRRLRRERNSISMIGLDGVLDSMAVFLSDVIAEAADDKAQLLTILSSMTDGLVAIDHRQRILLVNEAAEKLMAFRIPQPRGRLLWEVVPTDSILKAVSEVMLTGQRKTLQVSPVESRQLQVTVCRLPPADRPAGLVIVAHDITESARYEELRKEFVANVSHELRTPLSVIKGYVETLRDGALDDRPRAMRYLETVERHSEQLTNLVNDLLDLSRLDSAAGFSHSGPVSVDAIVRKVVELMQPAIEKKRQSLTVRLSPQTLQVLGNGDYLQRAISNLVENAVKYTPEGGSLGIELRQEAGWVIVDVTDNGLGIPEEEVPRIFERFYRVDRSRSREMGGTGLGLSIVKHIMQTHGGSVEVHSKVGEGSLFRLRLPAIEAAPMRSEPSVSVDEINP